MALQFNWDRTKAASNEFKHRVTFDESTSVFHDPFASIFDDERHTDDEYRELIIGHSDRRRLLIISFTEREDVIRIISARKATKREQADYERNRRK